MNYRIGGGLAPEQVQAIHDTALRVIDDVGVEVTDPETEPKKT